MAIEYSFYIESKLNSSQAKHLIAETLDMKTSQDGFVHKNDILISGRDITPGRSTEVIEEGFHFTPNLSVRFRCQHDADPDEFDLVMLRATMLLLEHGRDAVLLFNGERSVFHRLQGQLVFNADYKLWDESQLKQEVHIPYERRPLRSPLLE